MNVISIILNIKVKNDKNGINFGQLRYLRQMHYVIFLSNMHVCNTA